LLLPAGELSKACAGDLAQLELVDQRRGVLRVGIEGGEQA
jgi:hypothetical protein